MKPSDRIKAKVNRSRARNPGFFDFMEKNQRTLVKLKCRKTGAALQSLTDSEHDEQKIINGKQVTLKRQILVVTNEYAELDIEMLDADGALSKHSTPVSKTALGGTWTMEELEDLYASDLEEWAREGASDEYLEKMEARKPVRAL